MPGPESESTGNEHTFTPAVDIGDLTGAAETEAEEPAPPNAYDIDAMRAAQEAARNAREKQDELNRRAAAEDLRRANIEAERQAGLAKFQAENARAEQARELQDQAAARQRQAGLEKFHAETDRAEQARAAEQQAADKQREVTAAANRERAERAALSPSEAAKAANAQNVLKLFDKDRVETEEALAGEEDVQRLRAAISTRVSKERPGRSGATASFGEGEARWSSDIFAEPGGKEAKIDNFRPAQREAKSGVVDLEHLIVTDKGEAMVVRQRVTGSGENATLQDARIPATAAEVSEAIALLNGEKVEKGEEAEETEKVDA